MPRTTLADLDDPDRFHVRVGTLEFVEWSKSLETKQAMVDEDGGVYYHRVRTSFLPCLQAIAEVNHQRYGKRLAWDGPSWPASSDIAYSVTHWLLYRALAHGALCLTERGFESRGIAATRMQREMLDVMNHARVLKDEY
jgi:hypothetical protein